MKQLLFLPLLLILLAACRETPIIMDVKIGDTREVALLALERNGYKLQFDDFPEVEESVTYNPEAGEVATYNPDGILWGEDWKYLTLNFGPDNKVIRITLEKFGKIENKQHLDLMFSYLEDWYGKSEYLDGNTLKFGKDKSHYAFFVMNNNAILTLQ